MTEANNNHHFPLESAGRLMTTNIPIFLETDTIGDVEKVLSDQSKRFDAIDYIYITTKAGKLRGVISVKEVFQHPKSEVLNDFVKDDVVVARVHTDQERVVILALEHNIKQVPVVDKNDKLLGVVPADVILRVLHAEGIEDVLRMAGAGKFENPATGLMHASAWIHFRKRLPWLIIGLIGGMAAALIVRYFEEALTERIALASFIPAIVYMADAVGTQTETIFVRALSLDSKFSLAKYLFREIKVNLLISSMLAIIISVLSFMWFQSKRLSLVLGLSILLTVFNAMLVAVFLPWLFQKLKFDPAIASGPFATVICDIMSLVIYFGIATLLL